VNELAARLESVEHAVDGHGAGLAEATRSIETLADEIQSLEQFRIATEKTRRLILAAFGDKGAAMSAEPGAVTAPETARPEDTSQLHEEQQEGL
jgi:hypothetical protein